MTQPKKLTVLSDCDACECLYVGDKRWAHDLETTVYASDLAGYGNGKSVTLQYINLECQVEDWPKTLRKALRLYGKHSY